MTSSRGTFGLYDPEQVGEDYAHEVATNGPDNSWKRGNLLLQVAVWLDGGPVVTFDAFRAFVRGNAANDRNGNWGAVFEVKSADAGNLMVWASGDALARGAVPSDGMTRYDVVVLDSEVTVYDAGDGGLYRLADHSATDATMWAEVD